MKLIWPLLLLVSSSLQASSHNGPSDNPTFKKGQYTIRPQNKTTCHTYNEKQWTGTVDISDKRRLFYWFFDSRSNPETDPILIFLSGGPGASSMNALFQELGPCLVSPSNTSTPRPTSFNNAASVLFIDQPAGVGFSQIHPSSPYVQTDQEAAADLATFLTLFFKNVFPARAHLPIHFAGESYAGHYVPSTVKHILDERSVNARDAFWGNITSVVLVSPVLVDYQIYYGLYQLMCTTYRGHSVRWNESTCSLIERKTPAFDVMQVQCDAGNISTCRDLGDKYLDVWGILADEEDAGIRDTHNVDRGCKDPPLCTPPTQGSYNDYLNKPAILSALGFSKDFEFSFANGKASAAFRTSGSAYTPMTDVLTSVLDAHVLYEHQKSPIRVLVLNGNLDGTCSTPGQKWAWERIPWTGASWYRSQAWRELKELGVGMGQDGKGGEWKESKGGELLFIGLDGAGHMVPMDEGGLTDRIVRRWIGGWP